MSIRGLVLFAVAIIAACDDTCYDDDYDCYLYNDNPLQCGHSGGYYYAVDAGENCCVCHTPYPSVSPAPTSVCTLIDEGTDDASIGADWSDTAVTDYPNYGYVHGNCADCDEAAGQYGFLGAAGIEKTFDLPAVHSHVRISMRLWRLDSWDNEEMFIAVDGVTEWESGTLHGSSCAAGWSE